ncbi:hypothetical protein LCGC14_0978110 [marine sediment metagenome]|uniref:Uncharacterized protein n=1 Tax=marine sediment metagenome TaxID=412755 RepID=A0A0F9RG30_9ZZZZ
MGTYFKSRLDVDTAYGDGAPRVMRWRAPYLICAEYGSLTIYDMSDPSSIVGKDSELMINDTIITAMIVDPDDEDRVYLCNQFNDNVYSFDISDPTAIVKDDQLAFADALTPILMAKNGNYVYVAGGGFSVHIINVSDPTSLSEEALFTDATNIRAAGILVDPTGTYLFVTGNGMFSVFTFSGASLVFNNKTAVTYGGLDYQRMAQSADGYVYVQDYANDRIQIIDATDPTNVSLAGTLTDATYLDGVTGLQVVGDLLYAFNNISGVTDRFMSVWDITNRSSPTRLESLDLTADAPWATGRIQAFVVTDPVANLYIGRFSSTGVASYGAAEPGRAKGNVAHPLVGAAFI